MRTTVRSLRSLIEIFDWSTHEAFMQSITDSWCTSSNDVNRLIDLYSEPGFSLRDMDHEGFSLVAAAAQKWGLTNVQNYDSCMVGASLPHDNVCFMYGKRNSYTYKRMYVKQPREILVVIPPASRAELAIIESIGFDDMRGLLNSQMTLDEALQKVREMYSSRTALI